MNYAIKITSSEGDPIEIGDASANQSFITGLDIFLDTIDDHVRQKAGGMLAKVAVFGKIDDLIQPQLMELFNWAKELNGSKWYRQLEITIFEGGEIKRNYIFPDMFVVDYKENYRVTGSNSDDTFALYLTQKENNFKTIETF